MDSLSYFLFQPVLHNCCNKGQGMCYAVCGMVHIKEPLLLIGKSSPCGSSGFPLSLSEWSFTICPTPYNRKQNVLSASLNKTFPSFQACKFYRIQLAYFITNHKMYKLCFNTKYIKTLKIFVTNLNIKALLFHSIYYF